MKIIFHKYSGAGNDFILFSEKENPSLTLTPEFIRKICRRRLNIGADGVLYIKETKEYDFDVTYYNADGSTGSLCGNGARCAIRFAVTSEITSSNRVKFTSLNKIYSGELLDKNTVKFELNPPENIKLNFDIDFEGTNITAHFADTGSPHTVFFFDKLKEELQLGKNLEFENLDVIGIGKKIRFHKRFAPGGTNVNFVKIENGLLKIRTYERGVEDETLACGTGSVAAAVISKLMFGINSPITLVTKSNKHLTVEFDYNKEQFSNVNLIGPAEEIFIGTIIEGKNG